MKLDLKSHANYKKKNHGEMVGCYDVSTTPSTRVT